MLLLFCHLDFLDWKIALQVLNIENPLKFEMIGLQAVAYLQLFFWYLIVGNPFFFNEISVSISNDTYLKRKKREKMNY